MCHETRCPKVSVLPYYCPERTYFVILSNMDRGSNMKVGSVTRLRSAPGLSWEIICMSTTARPHVSCLLFFVFHCQFDIPLPCSGSTTVSSSVAPSFVSSTEERLPSIQRYPSACAPAIRNLMLKTSRQTF